MYVYFRCPKFEIFIEMFLAKLQSLVWSSQVRGPPQSFNMLARKQYKQLELTLAIQSTDYLNRTKKCPQVHFLILKLLGQLNIGRKVYIFRETRSQLCVIHCQNFEIQSALVSKQRPRLSWKAVNKYKCSTSYCLMRIKPLVALVVGSRHWK